MSDQFTPDPDRKRIRRLFDAWKRQEEESTATFAILMAGIATLFVAGIVSAFIFAKDNAEETARQQNAERAAASATAMPGAMGGNTSRQIPPIVQPETTGSGSSDPASRPKVHPRENEQNEEPWRR